MKKISLILLAALPIFTPLQAGWWSSMKSAFGYQEKREAPSIRVLIAHDVDQVNLQVKGPYHLYDPYTNSHISSRFVGKSRVIQPMSDGLKWGEAFPGLFQLHISPDEGNVLIQVDERDYLGDIYIYDIGQSISLVNHISIEEYLRDTLDMAEIQNLHPETLAAVAIAARTNAYFQAVNPKNTFWAVDGSKVGYNGYRTDLLAMDQALTATRYMVMSQTGNYEGVATPFALQFGPIEPIGNKDVRSSQISLEEAEKLAQKGEHAAQILAKAFPSSVIMLMNY